VEYIKKIYRTSFEASHYVPYHPKCSRFQTRQDGLTTLHDHEYKVTVLLKQDFFIDFYDIKEQVDGIVAQYDHENLGPVSSEMLALKIGRAIKQALKLGDDSVTVCLYETEKFGVEVTV